MTLLLKSGRKPLIGWCTWRAQQDVAQILEPEHQNASTEQAQLFTALHRTKLVKEGRSWQELRYSRCGRTDKGVSALGQACLYS